MFSKGPHVTRKILKVATVLLLAFFAFGLTPNPANAIDVPFLTWERGKEQFVILGGPTTGANWNIRLVGQDVAPLAFTGRSSETKGFNIYSVFLPNDLPLGAYTVQSDRSSVGLDIIAAVRVNERTFYQIAQIPPDLKLLLVLFAILASSFSVIRGRKYEELAFELRKPIESKNFLYNFRRKRQVSNGETFMRYLIMRDSEVLHKVSSLIWSILPWFSLLLGLFIGLSTQDLYEIPQLPLLLILTVAAIGAIDATSGIAAALGYSMVYIAFGNVNNLRTFLLLVVYTAIWYGPSIFAAMYSLTVPKDFAKRGKAIPSGAHRLIANLIAAIFAALFVVAAIILTDSLSIKVTSAPFMRWPLAATIAAIIFVKHLADIALKNPKSTDPESTTATHHTIKVVRVVSPGFAFTLMAAFFGIIYVWSNSLSMSATGAVLLTFPFMTLFLIFPEFSRIRLPRFERNILIETIFLAATTLGIFYGTQNLPMESQQKANLFLALGAIPLILHSLYSVLVASGELHTHRQRKEKIDTESEVPIA